MDKGFTLVELLVTIGIVGVLASIAIPQYNQYRSAAYNSTAISDLRNQIIELEARLIDGDGYFSDGQTGGLMQNSSSDVSSNGTYGIYIYFPRTGSTTSSEYAIGTCHEKGNIRAIYKSTSETNVDNGPDGGVMPNDTTIPPNIITVDKITACPDPLMISIRAG